MLAIKNREQRKQLHPRCYNVFVSSLLGFIEIIFIRNGKQPAVMYVVNKDILYMDLVDISDGKQNVFLK